MRHVLVGISLGALLLVTGCPNWSQVRNQGAPVGNGTPVTAGTPTAAQLVAYVNTNAAKIPSLECRDVIMDCKMDGQPAGLSGRMICQAPRSFFMSAKMLGKDAVIIGSNDREFWYWISEVKPVPYLFHCSYDDFNSGRAKAMDIPFQPDWLMDAMGMATLDPNGRYQVVTESKAIKLIQEGTSPQGQRISKVTVFSREPGNASYGKPQVLAHMVLDDKGHELCAAHISTVQLAQNGAVVPRRVKLTCQPQKTTMDLRFEEMVVGNPIDPSRALALFSRDRLANLQGFDLARGEDRARGPIQQTGGAR